MGTNKQAVEFEAQIKRVAHVVKEEKDEEGNVIDRWVETQVTLTTVDDPSLLLLQKMDGVKVLIGRKQLELSLSETAHAEA